MIEMITAWGIQQIAVYAGGSIAVLVFGWILAKIPTGKWSKQTGEAGIKHGNAFTIFAAKKIPLWNKVIEPVFIDTIGFITSYISGFIIGLKSDNKK